MTKVTLISMTSNPETTILKVWLQSRPQLWKDLETMFHIDKDNYKLIDTIYYHDHFYGVVPAGGIPDRYRDDYYDKYFTDFRSYVNKIIDQVLDTSLPPSECVNLVWKFDDVSVALREQLVRHRKTSPWVQSSRNNNDSLTFKGYIPESVHKKPEAEEIMNQTYDYIRSQFGKLLDLGIPSEDARMIMPEGRLHGLTWSMDLREFLKVMKERSCFISQGIWREILIQMVEELRNNGSEFLANKLGTPPCKYKSCIYKSENENRLEGADILPVCPLYCAQNGIKYPDRQQNKTYLKAQMEGCLRIWNKDKLSTILK